MFLSRPTWSASPSASGRSRFFGAILCPGRILASLGHEDTPQHAFDLSAEISFGETDTLRTRASPIPRLEDPPTGPMAPRDIVREDRPPENHARRILAIAAWRAAQPSKTVRAILRADDNLVGAGTEKRRQIEPTQHPLSPGVGTVIRNAPHAARQFAIYANFRKIVSREVEGRRDHASVDCDRLGEAGYREISRI